jgi:hypothetical protein
MGSGQSRNVRANRTTTPTTQITGDFYYHGGGQVCYPTLGNTPLFPTTRIESLDQPIVQEPEISDLLVESQAQETEVGIQTNQLGVQTSEVGIQSEQSTIQTSEVGIQTEEYYPIPSGFTLIATKDYRELLMKDGQFGAVIVKTNDDDFCPLSQDLIKNSKLDFAPDLCWDPTQPEGTTCELFCGHKFTATLLFFHFFKNSCWQCPVCKHGAQNYNWKESEFPNHVYVQYATQLFREQVAADHAA